MRKRNIINEKCIKYDDDNIIFIMVICLFGNKEKRGNQHSHIYKDNMKKFIYE